MEETDTELETSKEYINGGKMGRYEDEVIQYISKHTRITGVEAKNMHRELQRSGIDPQALDWRTLGEDSSIRTGGSVKKQIHNMYGVNLNRYEDKEESMFLGQQISDRQGRRSPTQLRMDNNRNARHCFKQTNSKGVQKWLKKPNRYDLKDVDDIIKF